MPKTAATAKQAMAKAQPKTTKPTGVTKESSVKVKTKADKPNKNTTPPKTAKVPAKKKDKPIQPANPKKYPYGTGDY